MNRQEIEENLPWYVNGQLPDEQMAEIDRQLKDDPALQQEVAFLRGLRQQIKQTSQPSPGEFGLQRLKRELKKEKATPLLQRWKTVAVAASLLMVVQAGVMVSMVQKQDTGIVPLSGSDYSGTVIQLQFREQATESKIRQLLLSVNGSIIEGPSASGVYRVRLESEEQEIVNREIEQLKNSSEIVDFVAAE